MMNVSTFAYILNKNYVIVLFDQQLQLSVEKRSGLSIKHIELVFNAVFAFIYLGMQVKQLKTTIPDAIMSMH